MRLAIVGGGVAGVAAAFAATRRGVSVTVFDAGVGATMLTSGAVDLHGWEWAPEAEPLDADTRAFVDALGLWAVDDQTRAWLCTGAGVLRPARGRDRSLLDVGALRDARVAVARIGRPGWDADAMARSLSAEPHAQRARLVFEAVDIEWLKGADERVLPAGDLAGRFDDPARIAWAAARVRDARRQTPFDALLVGPWLGAEAPRADALSAAAGVPVGETTSTVTGTAGERLVRALHAVLPPQVERVRQRVDVEITDKSVAVRRADGSRHRFDACLLAAGGVGAGGITLVPADPTIVGGPPPSLRGAAWADGTCAFGEPRDGVGWRAESPLPSLRWTHAGGSALERAGLLHERGLALASDRSALPHVGVAGDHAFAVPRTVLGAVRSAVLAVERLARSDA